MKRIGAFGRALWRQWVTLLTGGTLLAVLAIWQWTDHAVHQSLYYVLLSITFLIANYRTWLEQAARAEALSRPSLSLYLAEGDIRRKGIGGPRFYAFRVVVSNTSDAPNSIREARLFIEHRRRDGPTSNLEVQHNAALAAVTDEPLRLPCQILARSSIGGTVLFDVPTDLLRDSRVEACIVRVVDTLGLEASVEAILLREVAV